MFNVWVGVGAPNRLGPPLFSIMDSLNFTQYVSEVYQKTYTSGFFCTVGLNIKHICSMDI